MSKSLRHRFEYVVFWTKGEPIQTTVEMSYTLVSDWKNSRSTEFSNGVRKDYGSHLSFRVLDSHFMDLTTILAMEKPEIYREIQLKCLEAMETLSGEYSIEELRVRNDLKQLAIGG